MQPWYLRSTSSFLMIDSVGSMEIDPVKTKGHNLSDLSRASTPDSQQATPIGPPPTAKSPVHPAVVMQTTPPPAMTAPPPSVVPPQTPKRKFKVNSVIDILTGAYDRMGSSAQQSAVATTTNAPSAKVPRVPVKPVISLEKEQSLYIPKIFLADRNSTSFLARNLERPFRWVRFSSTIRTTFDSALLLIWD